MSTRSSPPVAFAKRSGFGGSVWKGGVPFPLSTGGVLSTIGLCSRHQALAIAHAFGAVAEAEGRTVAIRVWPYYVQYDIKARAMESDEAAA